MHHCENIAIPIAAINVSYMRRVVELLNLRLTRLNHFQYPCFAARHSAFDQQKVIVVFDIYNSEILYSFSVTAHLTRHFLTFNDFARPGTVSN